MAGASVSHTITVSVECEWKKRKHEDLTLYMEAKRPRQYYFRLESESSVVSDNDTESIYSIQDRETDFARDTTDTESELSDDGKSVFEVEYEAASLSENEDYAIVDSSSSGTEDLLEGAIAAAICETSIDAWATDNESSEDSSMEEFQFEPAEFYSCLQCKSRNDNPNFRYCDRCYQVRKTQFPPRPKGRCKKRKTNLSQLKSESLSQACSGSMSQDSGVGSSQEKSSVNFDTISLTSDLASNLASDGETLEEPQSPTDDSKPVNIESAVIPIIEERAGKRKRTYSESDEEKETANKKQKDDLTNIEINNDKDAPKELCIVCNTDEKNSIFLHGNIAHRCCCYKCSMKVWKSSRRCPICNCKVRNVVKVFTM